MYFEVLWEIFLTLAFQYILQPLNVSRALPDLDGIKEASTEPLGNIVAGCKDLKAFIYWHCNNRWKCETPQGQGSDSAQVEFNTQVLKSHLFNSPNHDPSLISHK